MSWEDLREERIRIEDALADDGSVEIHGSGGDLNGEAADISYHVDKPDGRHVYMITIEPLPDVAAMEEVLSDDA